jgi:hypothetical protein
MDYRRHHELVNDLRGSLVTVLTDTQVVTASGGLVELGYSEITSDVNIVSVTAGSGTEIIAPLTVVCDGGLVLVEFFAPGVVAPSTSGGTAYLSLYHDGSEKSRYWANISNPAAVTQYAPAYLSYRTTPTAGSHTFGVKGFVSSTTGTPRVSAGTATTAPAPAFLRVSKIVTATQWPAVTTGTIICTSSTRPASPFAGQQIYETDTSNSLIYNGTAWVSPQAQTVPPMVMARRTSSQTIVQNTLTPIQFDGTNVFDTNLMHSDSSASPTTPPASNNTRITIKTAGVYQLNGWGYFASGSATTYRLIGFSKNGTEILSTNPKAGGVDNRVQALLLDSAAVNDYYEMWMYHDQGASLGLSAVNGVYAMFSAHFIGKTA